MSDRSDRKLQQVPLASYNYRHEAEFAAGFLQDAGIPFRLQIEDPTLGLSATNSATIWVAAMDETKARQVLDHELATVDEGQIEDDDAWVEDEEGWVEDERWGASVPEVEASAGASSAPQSRPQRGEMRRRSTSDVSRHKTKPDLTLRQRLIALGGGVGVSGVLGIEAVREASMGVPVLVALMAVVLALAGVFGWAPGPLRRLLGALSGDAP